MIKSFIVDSTCNNMRFDRWLRSKLGNIPQSLIEKTLRSGKIKINKKTITFIIVTLSQDKIRLYVDNSLIKFHRKDKTR